MASTQVSALGGFTGRGILVSAGKGLEVKGTSRLNRRTTTAVLNRKSGFKGRGVVTVGGQPVDKLLVILARPKLANLGADDALALLGDDGVEELHAKVVHRANVDEQMVLQKSGVVVLENCRRRRISIVSIPDIRKELSEAHLA